MNTFKGIRIENRKDFIKIRGESFRGEFRGVEADLGKGVFVVTNEALKKIVERKIEYTPVKMVRGFPPRIRKEIREERIHSGVILPF